MTSTCDAHSWDVVMIMEGNDAGCFPGLLYEHPKHDGMLFLEETDAYTYDMMKAFGITRCHRHGIKVLAAQEIWDRNKEISTTIHRDVSSGTLIMNRVKHADGKPAISISTTPILDE